MKSPFLKLHTAIYDRIKDRTDYTPIDSTPKNEVFPYLTMGAISARDWSDKFTPGQEVDTSVHIWSQHDGKKEVFEIGDAVLQALTREPLDLGDDFYAVVDSFDDYKIIMDIDGKTRHGIISMTYKIEERR